MVASENLDEIKNLYRLNPTKEVCGIITSGNKVIQLTNISKTPGNCFVFSKREYFKTLNELAKEGKTILCIWHTHPGGSAEPSKADLEYVRLSKRNSLIVSSKDYRWIEYASNK